MRHNPIRLWVSAPFWRGTALALSSVVLATWWAALLTTLIVAGAALTITLIGLPLLAGSMVLWTYAARIERGRFRILAGARIGNPYRALAPGSAWRRALALARDPAVWRDLAYLLLALPVVAALELIALVVAAGALGLIAMPAYYTFTTPELWTGFHVDTLPRALLAAAAGFAIFLPAPYLVTGLARLHVAAGVWLLGPRPASATARRLEHLVQTRARAVDSIVLERRRIERDLHDGAQQRLVALAIRLGLARSRFDEDPEGARDLVVSAHEEAKRALSEIRDLVRGIHPAILTDRGLDAAISAVAGRSPVPVDVDVRLPRRPPPTVESTAYFVVAEAMTNMIKYGLAGRAHVAISMAGGKLLVEVTDDGKGGAVLTPGGGLSGLADRVAALDGQLKVDSPAGGPTRVSAELPCEW